MPRQGEMEEQAVTPHAKNPKFEAGAAGAGGGTLLVLLANNLPNNNVWKPWLVIIAPTATVAFTMLFSWLRGSMDRFLKKRQLKSQIKQTRQTLELAFQNPNTSARHRLLLRAELERLEMLLVRTDLTKIEALSVESHATRAAAGG